MLNNMLFLDIEWDLKTGNILSLGALCCNEKLETQKEFFSFVRPDNCSSINHEMPEFLHTTSEKLFNAPTVSDVGNAFFEKIDEINNKGTILIIWNRDAYTVFCEALKQIGYSAPMHKLVVLQDVLRFINYRHPKYYSQTFFLDYMGIEHEKARLHDSAYDVVILKEMYVTAMQRCIEGNLDNSPVVYHSKNSLVLHSDTCRYVAGIKKWNLVSASCIDIFNGYIPCRVCADNRCWLEYLWGNVHLHQKKQKSAVQLKSVSEASPKSKTQNKQAASSRIEIDKFSDVNIAKICESYGFQYRIGSNIIYIKTDRAAWRIYHNGYKVLNIFHKNHKYYKNAMSYRDFIHKANDINAGYHDQQVKCSTLEKACKYIYQHDTSTTTYKQDNESRIDILLKQLRHS